MSGLENSNAILSVNFLGSQQTKGKHIYSNNKKNP